MEFKRPEVISELKRWRGGRDCGVAFCYAVRDRPGGDGSSGHLPCPFGRPYLPVAPQSVPGGKELIAAWKEGARCHPVDQIILREEGGLMLALRERLNVLRDRRGFTMVEMMVVLIIIAVLIGVGIRFYLGYIENSRVTKAKGQIQTMQAALDSYYATNAVYPSDSSELLNAGLKVATGTSSPFTLDSTDPWGKNYAYNVRADKKAYVVYSGHNKVQGKDAYVVGRGKEGESDSPAIEVTTTAPTPATS